MEKRNYESYFHSGADNFRKSFMKILIEKIGKKKSLSIIDKQVFYRLEKNMMMPSLTSTEKFLKAIPNLKIKITNKLTKEELFFNSFKDVIVMVRVKLFLRHGSYAEAFRTEELLAKTFKSREAFHVILNTKRYLKSNTIHSILILLESLGLDVDIVLKEE